MFAMRVARLCSTVLSACVLAALPAAAQEYPSRPIRIIVPFAAGGAMDLLARQVGQGFTERWSQQVIVDNRPGAGGTIGTQVAAKAPADGYTLMMGSSSTLAIGPALGAKLPYDPIRDYTAVSQTAVVPILLVVHPALPVRSIPELIQLAKSRPGEIAYASNGVGTTAHIAAELFARSTKVQFNHVPYKGGGNSITDLLGGHLQLLFGAVSTSIPHMKAGKLRALGVTSRKRLSAIPDVPAIAERVPGFEVVQWFGVFAPAGTPRPIVNRVSTEVQSIIAQPAVNERFAQQGIEPISSTPDAFSAYVKTELTRWTKLLKEMGIQSEHAPQ
jgi:tripartite-type tricarboxylate transporter receptor subunit TctC